MNDKITVLVQSNHIVNVKKNNTINELQKKLKVSINKVNTLEKILKQRMMQTIFQSTSPSVAVNNHYFIQNKKSYIGSNNERIETRNSEEDLERALAEIFHENKNSHTLYNSNHNLNRLISNMAKDELGKKYIWGAVGPQNFDCSGFTSSIYNKLGIKIPRVSRDQAKFGTYIDKQNLKTGDLLFFDTSKEGKGIINHVGIYLENDTFIHASSAKKSVVITSLNAPFYNKRFKWARRVLNPK